MSELSGPGSSLRGRLLLWMIVMLAVVLALSSISAYLNGRRVADTAYDRTLLASARAITAGLVEENGQLKADIPYIALDNFAYDSAGRIYYQVIGIEGQLVSGWENLPAPPPKTPLTRDYPALARFYDGFYQGKPVRVVSLLRPISEVTLNGIAEIRVAETDEARERMARSLLGDTLVRLGVFALSAILLTWLVVRSTLQPLEQLRQAVLERSPDDLRPLPAVEARRELVPLVTALNLFTERLRHLFERQSRFIFDASHELRTPIAALKARLELGLRSDQPEQWLQTLQDARSSTDRLSHLANQLLSLARIESSAQAIAEGGATPVELGRLCQELGMALAPLAHSRGVDLAFEREGEVWVMGEATLLQEMVSNLVDNAMAHTPPGGNVILRVIRPCLLEIDDDGPGIPAEERAKVFQRFHRLDTRVAGTGLGLSIVSEISRAHRASIELLDSDSGGLRVRIVFPSLESIEDF